MELRVPLSSRLPDKVEPLVPRPHFKEAGPEQSSKHVQMKSQCREDRKSNAAGRNNFPNGGEHQLEHRGQPDFCFNL